MIAHRAPGRRVQLVAAHPSSPALPWPSFNGTRVLSLVPLQSQVTTDFATAHHCSFWLAG